MEHKGLGVSEVKIEDPVKGTFSAVFATFNKVDSDGDLTDPGAFPEGKQVPVSAYNHTSWSGALPVGLATITQTSTRAIAKGQFFMDTTHGRDTFITVKSLADNGLGEWSYGYDVLESEQGTREDAYARRLKTVDVHEVSPVLLGAGVGTQTLTAKNRKDQEMAGNPRRKANTVSSLPAHTAAMTSMLWEPGAMVDGLKGASIDDLRKCFAAVDITGDPAEPASYRYPHHHGADGPANARACIEGIAHLNSPKGSEGMSDEHRAAVYDHLARHLKEADREAPPLREPGNERKLHEEAIDMVKTMRDFLTHVAVVGTRRSEKGRSMSDLNVEALEWVAEDLRATERELSAHLKALHNQPVDALASEWLRFQQSLARYGG